MQANFLKALIIEEKSFLMLFGQTDCLQWLALMKKNMPG